MKLLGNFVVRADEKLTAFLELEAAICVPSWTVMDQHLLL